MFMPNKEIRYPGYRGGNEFVQNLASYREDVKWHVPGEVEKDNTLQLDIERHVRWNTHLDLLPYTYSAMANASYPKYSEVRHLLGLPSGAIRDEYDATVRTLPGFHLDREITFETHGMHQYINEQLAILSNWSLSWNFKNRITIAVVHYEEVASLHELLERIFPHVVDFYNILNPTRQLSPDIVSNLILQATEQDTVQPRCRVPESERHW